LIVKKHQIVKTSVSEWASLKAIRNNSGQYTTVKQETQAQKQLLQPQKHLLQPQKHLVQDLRTDHEERRTSHVQDLGTDHEERRTSHEEHQRTDHEEHQTDHEEHQTDHEERPGRIRKTVPWWKRKSGQRSLLRSSHRRGGQILKQMEEQILKHISV